MLVHAYLFVQVYSGCGKGVVWVIFGMALGLEGIKLL